MNTSFPEPTKPEPLLLTPKLTQLYQELSELTKPRCAGCPVPHSCCAPEYCQMAITIARERGTLDLLPDCTDHPTLPFMGPNGCILEPHHRPLCTRHVCSMNGLGVLRQAGSYGMVDIPATEEYFRITNEIDRLELGL